MKRKITDTTFGKLTVAYLLFGVIPLFLISLLFFSRFTDNIRETMIRNYAQINGYFARNVQTQPWRNCIIMRRTMGKVLQLC